MHDNNNEDAAATAGDDTGLPVDVTTIVLGETATVAADLTEMYSSPPDAAPFLRITAAVGRDAVTIHVDPRMKPAEQTAMWREVARAAGRLVELSAQRGRIHDDEPPF